MDTLQTIRGCVKGDHDIVRHGTHGGPQASGRCRICYVVPDRVEAKASNAVMAGMVLMCHHSASILFGLGSSYSYTSTYFTSNIDIMRELLAKLICVFTSAGKSLVVNQVYWVCVVTFIGRDIVSYLILLDMVDFDLILGMDWLSHYHDILDCHVKIMTLSCLDLP